MSEDVARRDWMEVTNQLSDAEIALSLKELGADCGPVTDATRRVYKRKLMRLSLGGTTVINDVQPVLESSFLFQPSQSTSDPALPEMPLEASKKKNSSRRRADIMHVFDKQENELEEDMGCDVHTVPASSLDMEALDQAALSAAVDKSLITCDDLILKSSQTTKPVHSSDVHSNHRDEAVISPVSSPGCIYPDLSELEQYDSLHLSADSDDEPSNIKQHPLRDSKAANDAPVKHCEGVRHRGSKDSHNNDGNIEIEKENSLTHNTRNLDKTTDRVKEANNNGKLCGKENTPASYSLAHGAEFRAYEEARYRRLAEESEISFRSKASERGSTGVGGTSSYSSSTSSVDYLSSSGRFYRERSLTRPPLHPEREVVSAHRDGMKSSDEGFTLMTKRELEAATYQAVMTQHDVAIGTAKRDVPFIFKFLIPVTVILIIVWLYSYIDPEFTNPVQL